MTTLKHIRSVGVELEGGIPLALWDYLRELRQEDDRVGLGSDGSVSVHVSDARSHNEKVCRELFKEGKECIIKYWDRYYMDAEIKFWSEDWREVLDFAKLLWDYGFMQNNTCGNHVHFKLDPDVIASLDEVFVRRFQSAYRRFAKKMGQKYLDRITSRYASFYQKTKEWMVENVINSNRYKAVNLLSLFEEQETLEIRILPYANDYGEYATMFTWLVTTVDRLIGRTLKETFVDAEFDFDILDIKPMAAEV